jgi:SAM-dependent methyltransferase
MPRIPIMKVTDLGAPDSRLRAILAHYPATLFTDQLHRSSEAADLYALELTFDLLRSWRIDRLLEPPASAATAAARLGFVSAFLPAFEWLLERAAAAGVLAARGAPGDRVYAAVSPLPPPRLGELRALGLEVDPRLAATLDLLDAAAATYPAVATGATAGEEALFAPARAELWARYFDQGNPVYAVNNQVAAIAAAERVTAERPLRVIEVGAGGGSGSLALAQALADRGVLARVESFLLTEPSPFFRRRAERALRADRPALPLRVAALDVDGDWNAQGAAEGSWDLVFGVNVMHVARDLAASLRSARRALRPGGWLVIGECLRPLPGQPVWPEFIFRLLGGFNRVEIDPELRPNAGFLTPEQWLRILSASGFVELSIEPDLRRIRDLYPRFITGALCARRPSREAADDLL